MILVLLGTQHNEFIRLIKEVEKCINTGTIKEKVIVQAGFTKYKSDKMETFDMISNEKLTKYVDEATLVITHGGVGSIVSSIKLGKKVIAIPRLHQYQEHVNDHQKQIVKSFSKKGYIIGINDVEELEEAIYKAHEFIPNKYETREGENRIIKIIEQFIENI